MSTMSALKVFVASSVVLEEEVVFSLAELSRASGAAHEQLQALVNEGLLQPSGRGPADWRFSGLSLPLARTALRLSRDLELSPTGVVLVMELLDEIRALRQRAE
jgi:chaperone modulatory protein CbpM